jgi:multiple sugar transport system permease protein
MKGADYVLKVLVYFSLAIGVVIMLLPLVWMFSASFKPLGEVMRTPPTWIPLQPTVNNYKEVFRQVPFAKYYLNSVIVAIIVIGSVLITSSLAAYVFAKFEFPGKQIWFFLILSSLMVPFQVRMIPLYRISVSMGITDTLFGVSFPWLVDAFGIFLMRQFIITIPTELIEVARIDGASEPLIFWRVILPNCKQALSALAIFTFAWNWEEFLWPLIASNSNASRTIPIGLQSFAEQYGSNVHWQMAGAVVAIVPLLLVFMLLEKQFVEGITMTGLKG